MNEANRSAYRVAHGRKESSPHKKKLEQAVTETGKHLRSFGPRAANGLIAEHVRITPEYQTAKKNAASAFSVLRTYNGGGGE